MPSNWLGPLTTLRACIAFKCYLTPSSTNRLLLTPRGPSCSPFRNMITPPSSNAPDAAVSERAKYVSALQACTTSVPTEQLSSARL